jgi:hypothetical protein
MPHMNARGVGSPTSRSSGVLSCEVKVERLAQAVNPGVGDAHRAGGGGGDDPLKLDEPVAQASAGRQRATCIETIAVYGASPDLRLPCSRYRLCCGCGSAPVLDLAADELAQVVISCPGGGNPRLLFGGPPCPGC